MTVDEGGGLLRIALKEGDGDGWSSHGSVSGRRHFTYWRGTQLEPVVTGAGWTDVAVRSAVPGTRGESWLALSAVRGGVSG